MHLSGIFDLVATRWQPLAALLGGAAALGGVWTATDARIDRLEDTPIAIERLEQKIDDIDDQQTCFIITLAENGNLANCVD